MNYTKRLLYNKTFTTIYKLEEESANIYTTIILNLNLNILKTTRSLYQNVYKKEPECVYNINK